LHRPVLLLQKHSKGNTQRREKVTQIHRAVVLREGERKHVEADAGTDTKTMTKMRKRKNKMKE
jgi:hypothetical protein